MRAQASAKLLLRTHPVFCLKALNYTESIVRQEHD